MDYFNLGETIAVLGIIIAVYGLIKPLWRLNFDLNPRIYFSVVYLVILGLLSSLIAFILSAFTTLNIYSVLFQGSTYIFFIFAAIDFIRGVSWKKPLYSYRSTKKAKIRFIQRILNETLFYNNDDSINAVINVVKNSLDEICKDIACNKHNENIAAYFIETLLGENKFVNHIVEKRIDFIHKLISSLEKNHVRGFDINNGIGNLITALYVNPKSYLYQQIGYAGLTNYASIYKIIFENEYFVREYGPIANWYNVEQKVNYRGQLTYNENYVKVFIKGFILSLKKFAYTKNDPHQNLAKGMYQLAEYAQDVSREISKLSEPDYFAPPSKAFGEVIKFVSHDFYYDIFKGKASDNKITNSELSPQLKTEKYEENLSSAFCRLFSEMAEKTIIAYSNTVMERHEVIQLNEIFLQSIGNYAHIGGIRKKILHDLWERSNENIEKGYFPIVFRALTIMLYWKHSNMPAWAVTERNKLIDTLENKVKPRILRKELMADDKTLKEEALLPQDIVFNKKMKKFYQIDARGTKRELKK